MLKRGKVCKSVKTPRKQNSYAQGIGKETVGKKEGGVENYHRKTIVT